MGSSTKMLEELKLAQEDLKLLSGPAVWPVISAEKACDRFIHKRPELWYLLAKKRQRELRGASGLEPAESIIIKIYEVGGRRRGASRRAEGKIGEMEHFFSPNRRADVRRFLVALRSWLDKNQTDAPIVGVGVRLQFFDRDIKYLSDFRTEWM